MNNISKNQYEFALIRIEELLLLVNEKTFPNDRNVIELSVMSDIVIAYEKDHFPIEKSTVSELIALSLEEKGMTQKQLAGEIGISPSRINDYIAGRSDPTLKIAHLLCKTLDISANEMLRL
jgi:HTH-type transcriptional regulator/antitoxin HigA